MGMQVGGLLAVDDNGHDRHLDDLAPADQRDIVLKAAGLQFFHQLVDRWLTVGFPDVLIMC